MSNLRLELALSNSFMIAAIPEVGDFVNREESGWIGYVRSRRWTIRKDGDIDVRCWLNKDSL